jgi:hypothetical protein
VTWKQRFLRRRALACVTKLAGPLEGVAGESIGEPSSRAMSGGPVEETSQCRPAMVNLVLRLYSLLEPLAPAKSATRRHRGRPSMQEGSLQLTKLERAWLKSSACKIKLLSEGLTAKSFPSAVCSVRQDNGNRKLRLVKCEGWSEVTWAHTRV